MGWRHQTKGKTADQLRKSHQQIPLERIIAALPSQLRRVIAVLRFEIKRTQTVARISVWALLATFPIAIMALFRYDGEVLAKEEWGIVLYGLIPQVVCLLGLLLWVAPLVNSEIEGRTWVYVAVRPGGKLALLIGKYLNGVLWTCSAAWVGLTVGMLVGRPSVTEPWRLWLVLALLVLLASFGYGAAYAVIGALFHRRAMVLCVGYVLLFEVIISNIPAVVNQLTVQYRLFNLLFLMMDWRIPPPWEQSDQSVAHHIFVLVLYVTVLFSLAACVLRFREYSTADEA